MVKWVQYPPPQKRAEFIFRQQISSLLVTAEIPNSFKEDKIAAAQKSVPSTKVRSNIASKTIAAATTAPATATATTPAPTQTLLQKHAA